MSWTVGRVKITKIVETETVGSTRFILPLATHEEIQKLPWLIPDFATEDGRLKMSIHSLLVETPSRRIIVDTGLGNDKQGRNVPTWNNRNDPFLDRLTAAGFPPDSIDTVLCTHLHVDHVGWNTRLVDGKWVPTFTNARYVFGKTEFEYWRDHSDAPDRLAVFNNFVKPIADAGKADLVASNAQLADEITLIPTPGHSPGHMSVHIKSDGAEALLTGDVAHHPCQMAHLDWSSTANSDPAQSVVTRRELFSRFADTPTLVIGGHFGAGHIKRDGAAFRFAALDQFVGWAKPPGRANARPMTGSACPPSCARGWWWARRGRLCPPYPALSAVEFPRPLFQEASEGQKFPDKSQETPAGSDKMKLVCYGAKGAEKPGLIDKSGQLRDLSAQVKDLDGEAYSPAWLAKLAGLDTSKLPAVDGKQRFGAPVIGISKFVAIGLNYSDHAKETDFADPTEPIFFIKANTSLSGPNDAVEKPRGSPSSTGKSRSPPSSAPAPSMSRKPTRSTTSPAIASAMTFPSAISSRSAAVSGPRASRTTPSARSAHGW